MVKNIILFLSQGLMTGDELYKLLKIRCVFFQGGHRLRPQKIGLLLKSIMYILFSMMRNYENMKTIEKNPNNHDSFYANGQNTHLASLLPIWRPLAPPRGLKMGL